jgi:hypothetical protein
MDVTQLDFDEWEEALPDREFAVFHTPEALRVLDEYADGDLRLFGAFKGDQPVALLPLFVRQAPVGQFVTSPPPSKSVPHLGPLVMPNSPKRRKAERVNRTFVEDVLDELDVDTRRSLFRMVCQPEYTDPRPYDWSDYDITPRFTYVIDTESSSPKELRDGFSSSLRREIRDAEELDFEITVEGVHAARKVYQQTERRFEEQDESFPFTWSYVRDLLTALDERARVYVARDSDGNFLTGITALYSNDRACFWQGGTRTTYEGVSINSAIHWRIIEDIAEDPPFGSVTEYDLFGANTPRLCRYKAKFGADLVPYYVVESSGPAMDIAKRAYELVQR